MRRRSLLLIFCVALLPKLVSAQPTPPGMSPTADGTLEGRLLEKTKGGEKPLADYPVTLEVAYDGASVLTLPKKTDAKGNFVFRFIESNPHFSYMVSATFQDREFRSEALQRPANADTIKTKLVVGKELAASGAPFAQAPMGLAPAPAEMPMPQAVAQDGSNWPKALALVFIVGIGVWFLFRRLPLGNFKSRQALIAEWNFLHSAGISDVLSQEVVSQRCEKLKEEIRKRYE